VEATSETPLVFEGGAPALVLARRGDGTVAFFATTLDDAWTDLPLRPGYLPLVVRLLRRLAPAGSAPESPVVPGSRISITPPAGAVRLGVVAPNGERLVHDAAQLERIEFDATAVPGVYRVEIATRTRELREEPRLAFVVAPPAEESDLTPAPIPASQNDERSGERTSVVERPLSPWLFLIVGLLAIAEAALRMRVGQLARKPG
jgi:hypothetical protein